MEGNAILDLYRRATQNVKDADWPARYQAFCEKVRAVKDWTDHSEAPDDLVKEVISTSKNGIASMGWAWNRWLEEVDNEKESDEYRKLLNHIKDGLGKASPAVEVYRCRKEFDGIIGGSGFDSFFNRIVAAFLPGVISPVVTAAPFEKACRRLEEGGYVKLDKEGPDEDPWYAKNVQLMAQLRQLLPDGPGEGARWPINDYTRGVFVYGVGQMGNEDARHIKENGVARDVQEGEILMNDETKEGDVARCPHNLIVFGAPGTGKSHHLEGIRQNAGFASYERVTFYPTYSYAQFVGTYKPVMNEKAEIAYAFVPGPFLRMLVKATTVPKTSSLPDEKFLLLIEEINRANAAAVFGDMFQLLDRDNGESEYPIAASEDVKGYLQKELDRRGMTAGFGMKKLNDRWEGVCQLSLPSNLYIWATMNSADQGVFPMDTAFKRRWEFEYIGIDESSAVCDGWEVEGGNTRSKWNDVRSFINSLLSLNGVNEDKLMGPFFVKAENNNLVSKNQFEAKVLMYLWEDVARMCRSRLFANIQTYSDLVEEWRGKGVEMFRDLMKEGSPASNNKWAASCWKRLSSEPLNGAD